MAAGAGLGDVQHGGGPRGVRRTRRGHAPRIVMPWRGKGVIHVDGGVAGARQQVPSFRGFQVQPENAAHGHGPQQVRPAQPQMPQPAPVKTRGRGFIDVTMPR